MDIDINELFVGDELAQDCGEQFMDMADQVIEAAEEVFEPVIGR
jgi:hypothetical protein